MWLGRCCNTQDPTLSPLPWFVSATQWSSPMHPNSSDTTACIRAALIPTVSSNTLKPPRGTTRLVLLSFSMAEGIRLNKHARRMPRAQIGVDECMRIQRSCTGMKSITEPAEVLCEHEVLGKSESAYNTRWSRTEPSAREKLQQ